MTYLSNYSLFTTIHSEQSTEAPQPAETTSRRLQHLGLTHEECWAVYLTSSNRILESWRISQGGVQATIVDHRIIIKRALELLATRLVLIHNHPSGSTRLLAGPSRSLPKPSEEST